MSLHNWCDKALVTARVTAGNGRIAEARDIYGITLKYIETKDR